MFKRKKNRSSLFASSVCLSFVYVYVMKTVCTCIFVLSSLLTFILTRGIFKDRNSILVPYLEGKEFGKKRLSVAKCVFLKCGCLNLYFIARLSIERSKYYLAMSL